MPGMSNNMGTGGNRSSVPGGMTVNTVLGNMGPRINSSVGNMVGTGSAGMGRTITSGGVNVPGITSRMNLTANAGSGNINVQGSNRLMSGMLPQGNIFCGPAIWIDSFFLYHWLWMQLESNSDRLNFGLS